MFVEKIGNINKTRFGINFKADDIKCNIKTDINNKIFKGKKNNKTK